MRAPRQASVMTDMRICLHILPTPLDRLCQQPADLSLLHPSVGDNAYKQVLEY